MLRFSANLGFLWTDRPLPEAIRAACRAGFDAVECHWPCEPAADVRAALAETGLPMLALNTDKGDLARGEFGLCALSGREEDGRAAIDAALAFGQAIGARTLHVLAGCPGEAGASRARDTYLRALAYASDRAERAGMHVLIEPLNPRDAPGYYLCSTEQAAEIVAELGRPNLRIMFDCYHVQIIAGDLIRRLERLLPLIGHIQIAAVPSRAEPDEGEVAYERLLPAIAAMGYDGYIGAEYRPRGRVEDGLGWLARFRAILSEAPLPASAS